MIWTDGRFSWPAVLMVLFSTIAAIVVDYAWRMVQAPISVIAGAGLVFLLAGNAVIFFMGRGR